ncbi:MAG TPA: LysM peptidoglycan-binding domain-containing protein [Anaerolineales bacterium]
MASMKRGAVVASTLMLIAVIASACNQPYSQAPSVTNTPINPTSLFATPIGETPEITMSDIANFGTSTALAQTGTPLVVETQTLSVGVATQDLSATATPLVSTNPAFTSTATLAVSGTQSGTLPTSAPVGTRPTSYLLHKGEFPYCLARRFDVDPDALLSLNGLSSGNIYYPSLTLKIPQSGSFPGTRALRNHPATYTVSSSDETIYGIACLFGDVDPAAIATANNISADAALTAGKQLSIP